MVLKREAFKHENEVRLLVCMQAYREINKSPFHINIYGFNFNPSFFIDSITFDPRADDWFVDTMIKYCKRKGFTCPITKSKLYQNTLYDDTKLIVTYTPKES
jgi:hypothetical protein